MRFSNKTMAVILGESQTKTRRWAKEFLPLDPKKGLRSGKTRRHSLNNLFMVFLGGYLVNDMGFSVSASKTILTDLRPWMERVGLLPAGKANFGTKNQNGNNVERYDIYIMFTGKPLAFCYEFRGVIRELKDPHGIVRSQYTVEFSRGTRITETNPIIDHARILSISNLLYRFQMRLSCNGSQMKPHG